MRRSWFITLCLAFQAFSAIPARNEIRIGLSGFPPSNLFYLAFDEYSDAITQLVLEPLVRLNLDDLTPEPALASSFSTRSEAGQFEFQLNPKARFSDGSPVTSEDVLFTCATLTDAFEKGRTPLELPSYLISCEALSPRGVRIKTKTPFPAGLGAFSEFYVLSKKHFSKGTFFNDFNSQYVGSGPYRFREVAWGKAVVLQRNPDYWANEEAQEKGRYFLDTISFHTRTNPNLLLKLLLNHEIDYLYFLSSQSWIQDTQSAPFKNGSIRKLEVKNKLPFNLAGIAWNLRKPIFSDIRVRKALAHLLNRERLIKDFFFDQYQLSSGIAYNESIYHHPQNRPLGYDPSIAQRLLKEAGWVANKKSILEKDGKPFSFEILSGNPPAAKYLAFYQEALRKAGIELRIKIVDWATYIKLRNEGRFDAIDFSRNRNEKMLDLEMLWLSQDEKGQPLDNLFGYKNPEANRLLTQLRSCHEESRRIALIRELDKLIADDHPMAFTWEPKHQRIAFWDQYDFKAPGYRSFSRWNQLFIEWKRKPQS